jgi:hypothetical protein
VRAGLIRYAFFLEESMYFSMGETCRAGLRDSVGGNSEIIAKVPVNVGLPARLPAQFQLDHLCRFQNPSAEIWKSRRGSHSSMTAWMNRWEYSTRTNRVGKKWKVQVEQAYGRGRGPVAQ